MLRYNHIRPRRMAFAGNFIAAVASNYASFQLFNNSAYAEYLLVRNWSVSGRGTVEMFAGAHPN